MKSLTTNGKNFIQYAFLLILIGITVYLVSTTLDINLIPEIVKMVNIDYIFIGILLLVAYIVLEALIIKIIINSIHKENKHKISFKLATMGIYYNLVTPFASGSQPMQIYALTKYDVSFSKAAAIVTNKTVLYQSIVTIYSIVFLLTNINVLNEETLPIIILVLTGIGMNITLLLGGVFILHSPEKVKFIADKTIKFLLKFRVFKGYDEKINKINNYIDEFNYSVRKFIKNWKQLVLSIFLTIAQLTLFFSIVYCIYKAFGLRGVSYIELVALQVFLYMSVSPIPTPGNIGANEFVFLTIFENILPKATIGYSVFLYSGFVYYFMLIFCGIFTINTHYRINKKDKKKKIENSNISIVKRSI